MPEMGRPVDLKSLSQFSNAKMLRSVSEDSLSDDQKNKEIISRLNGKKFGGKDPYQKVHSKELGKDEFLKLLAEQMQHQDPMDPMDQKRMMGDLAQLSQLEQLANMRTMMEKQNNNRLLENKFYASSLIGKRIYTDGSTINIGKTGEGTRLRFNIDEDSSRVMIRVFDKKMNMVAQITKENLQKGDHEWTWDGQTLDGNQTPEGEYTFQVKAYKDDQNEVKTSTKVAGIVNAVEFQGDQAVLVVGNKKIDLFEVDRFDMPDSPLEKKDLATSLPKIDDETKSLPKGQDISLSPQAKSELLKKYQQEIESAPNNSNSEWNQAPHYE